MTGSTQCELRTPSASDQEELRGLPCQITTPSGRQLWAVLRRGDGTRPSLPGEEALAVVADLLRPGWGERADVDGRLEARSPEGRLIGFEVRRTSTLVGGDGEWNLAIGVLVPKDGPSEVDWPAVFGELDAYHAAYRDALQTA